MDAQKVSADCNCDWITDPGACQNDDGSVCWKQCCTQNNIILDSLKVSAGCNCKWTRNRGACSNNDGSFCWRLCCLN